VMSNVKEFSRVDDGSKKTRGKVCESGCTHVKADGKSQRRASRGDLSVTVETEFDGGNRQGLAILVDPHIINNILSFQPSRMIICPEFICKPIDVTTQVSLRDSTVTVQIRKLDCSVSPLP